MQFLLSKKNWVSLTCFTAILSVGFISVAHSQQASTTSDGPTPDLLPPQFQHAVGDGKNGQDVFRFGTFNNQAFWTDAMQLPQGIAAAGLTPLRALQLGLNVNVDNLNAATVDALSNALKQVAAGTDPLKTAIGDPNVTLSLLNQNAVIGVVVFDPQGKPKAPRNTGTLNLAAGDKVGLTCALCHAITDNSVLPPVAAFGTKGSVGKEIDGPSNHGLDVGTILAAANRTLAYYPMLQLNFKALNNASVGHAPGGLATTVGSVPTEAQADAYLTGSGVDLRRHYPVGQFDPLPDGIGNPMAIPAFFRTDLSAPWGIDGAFPKLDDFNNFVYTVSLDPTSLLTPGGREFLHVLAGPVGDEIANDYEQVLKSIGVIPAGKNTLEVVPFVRSQDYLPSSTLSSTVGRRVSNQALIDLNAYLNSLQAPAPAAFDAALAERGRQLFRTTRAGGGAGCTACHQLDPNKFVPPIIIPMSRIYPGYNPTVLFNRPAPLSPIQKSFGGPSPTFDDAVVVVDATVGGGEKGIALPLKLDLARRTSLLHNNEITGATFDEAADKMMNPSGRDPRAPHPFFVTSADDRKALIEFMKSLTATPPTFAASGVANAASFMNGALAPGELIVISGTGLGVGLANATMQNTTVSFDGTAAPLISLSSSQLLAIVPFDVVGKSTAKLVVTVNGVASAPLTTNIQPTAPGLFSLAGGGSGLVAALNQDGSINSQSNPAARGSIVALYGTGAGALTPSSTAGQVVGTSLPRVAATVSAAIDGQNATVTYAGGATGLLSSVVQFNVLVPQTAAIGSDSISINAGGVNSQTGATIWIK